GSAGMDVETTVDLTITDSAVHLVETNVKGPLEGGLSAFLLQRSSSKRGLDVIPGVIDADYQGVIKIMVRTFFPPVSIPKGSRIAQLVTFKSCVPCTGLNERGAGGFGSTGNPEVHWTMDIMRGKPDKQVTLTHPNGNSITKRLTIDTGADVTIIS
ncbi:DUT nucleotidohydrolase, partial [Vidua macroura]|nr:DUT nucleotidohydrolase [Vidua macroura]